jgi:hypothetical protein
MPRPRTPTKILDARGSFKKHPERRRDGEPEVTSPLGSFPKKKITADGCWKELADIAPLGVLTGADRLSVEIAANLMVEYRKAPDEMQTSRLTLLNRLLGQFGMTPSDRARLSIPKAGNENPFAALNK